MLLSIIFYLQSLCLGLASPSRGTERHPFPVGRRKDLDDKNDEKVQVAKRDPNADGIRLPVLVVPAKVLVAAAARTIPKKEPQKV